MTSPLPPEDDAPIDRDALLRALWDSDAGVAVYEAVRDADGRIVDFTRTFMNPAGRRMAGIDASSGPRRMLDERPGNLTVGIFEQLAGVVGNGEALATEVRYDADGLDAWYAISASRAGDGVLVLFRDVTERRRAQAALDEAHAAREELLASMSDGVFTMDHDHRITYVNDAMLRILGMREEDLLGHRMFDVFPQARGTAFEDAYTRALDGEGPLTFEEYYPPPLDTWFQVRAYPSERGMTGYFLDIGEQRRLEGRLEQAQRMETVGQLAGGIAHDFNNLLTVVGGHAELLAESLAADADTQRDVAAVVDAARRGAELVTQLLAFSRQQVLHPERRSAAALADEVAPMLRSVLPTSLAFSVDGSADAGQVLVDPAQFHQMLANLVLNARDACGDGGSVTVAVLGREVDEAEASTRPGLAPGDYTLVTVTDDGEGMSPEVAARALEPFFTTKEPGAGSGLGLASVYGIVTQSGGHVEVDSAPGRGTTVRVLLPRVDVPTAPVGDAVRPASGDAAGATILLVEDHVQVREATRRMLERLGHTTLPAADGEDALARARGHDGTIDLLLTDVVMPGLDGPGLADALAEERPGLPVLFVSGYTDHRAVRGGDGATDFLAKPFSVTDLAETVRSLLGGRPVDE
ncbi:MAG: PAS domain-containing protein [Egibacteraceae bacterium]